MEKLPPENHEIVADDLCTVVRPLPRNGLVLGIVQLFPDIIAEVQFIGAVHLFLIESSTSEYDHFGFVTAEVHGEVGAGRGDLSFLL